MIGTFEIFKLRSMDLHPSREMVASGQRAGRNRKTQAHVRIWSPETLLTLYVFGMGEFDIGVSAVAFSQLVSILATSLHVSLPHVSLDDDEYCVCRTEAATCWQ
jgi:hypothetical protein